MEKLKSKNDRQLKYDRCSNIKTKQNTIQNSQTKDQKGIHHSEKFKIKWFIIRNTW